MKLRFLFFALGLISVSAQAATELKYRNQGTGVQRMLIDDGKVRMDINTGGDYMIFDGQKQVMYMVSPKRQEYTVMDKESLKKVAGMANEAMKQLEAQLASLPPEQRAQMQKMMGGIMPSKKSVQLKVVATGQQDKAAMGTCEWHAMMVNGQKSNEACLADVDDLGIDAEAVQSVNDMFAFMQDMLSAIPMANMEDMDLGPFKEGMLPIKTRDRQGRFQGEMLGAEEVKVNAADFTPPAAFRARRMDEGM